MRPIDADTLMERLNRKKAGPANQRYTEGFNDCLMRVRSMVHSAPTLTPPNEWVSVEERLPTIEKDYGGYGSVSVNIFNGKSVLPMDYESSVVRGKKVFRWKYPWNRIYDGEPITHWMPLPAPPDRRPLEGDCEIKACAETCDECGFCDNTLAGPPEGEEDL